MSNIQTASWSWNKGHIHHFDAEAGAAPFQKIKQPHGHGTILCIRIPRNFTAHALVHCFALVVPILDFVVFVYIF
jgi:hypothetical protein